MTLPIMIGFCLLLMFSHQAYAESLETGWQEARIQQVMKARKLMEKERERKRKQDTENEPGQDHQKEINEGKPAANHE